MTAASPAGAYDRHVGRYGAELAAALLDVAGVRAGQRVLDVGCGPGPLTRALADVVGAENVAAVDPSAPFVEACRRRVPGADVREAVGEALPFEDDGFDVVLAQLVVQLMDDREAGVREMARVTRPAGTVAACVWNSRRMPLLRAFWDAAADVAPERAGVLDEGRQIGYPSPDDLATVFRSAGLHEIATGELSVSAGYTGFDDLLQPFRAGVGHSGACFASLERPVRAELVEGIRDRLGRPGGPFTLQAHAWWARGRSNVR
jgi:SAM-dependent methyltransferase